MPYLRTMLLLLGLAGAPLPHAAARAPDWIRQFGTLGADHGLGAACDRAGNVLITGSTSGSLGGPSAGGEDVFLAKYDVSGVLLWIRQLGTSGSEVAYSVAVDGSGNIYICGGTSGSLGGPGAGVFDVFLAKYDASGVLLWIRQLGTIGLEVAYSVAVNSAGDAYISGFTTYSLGGPSAGGDDIFLARYDASGVLLWIRQLGTPQIDRGQGVAVDGAAGAYITGYTVGSLGGPGAGAGDAFLARYDASGTQVWMRQLGTSAVDRGTGVAMDSAGGAYITGYTRGNLGGPNAGNEDAFLARYDASGAQLWIRQQGTSAAEYSNGAAVDRAGRPYITGYTYSATSTGGEDAFLTRYDSSGALPWTVQVGTSAWERSFGVAVGGAGTAYIIGATAGSLGGPISGSVDGFLARYSVPPPCYANCDGSATSPILNVNDFVCFLGKFDDGLPYSNCDGSTAPPILNVNDFICFASAYAAGCP